MTAEVRTDDGGFSFLPTTWVRYMCPHHDEGCLFKVDIPEMHVEWRRQPNGDTQVLAVGYSPADVEALLDGMFGQHFRADHTHTEWDALRERARQVDTETHRA